jgi:hypothetical protein
LNPRASGASPSGVVRIVAGVLPSINARARTAVPPIDSSL